jgi:hypothetical protein
MKHSCIALAVAAMLLLPLTATALEGPRGPAFGLRFVDVVFVRPVMMVGSLASTALAIGLSPLTWMTGVGDESVEYMVVAPWRFTAHRYPGEFAYYKDGRSATGRALR